MPARRGRTRRARQVRIARLPGAEDLALPAPSTPGAAGLDLPAAVDGEMVIEPGARALVPTGFAIAVPPGLRSEEHTSELQSRRDLVCRLLLEKKKKKKNTQHQKKKKKKNINKKNKTKLK